MNQGKWIVLKFGGSVLHGPEDFQDVQSDISRFISEGFKVISVVSAYTGKTEALISEAKEHGLSFEDKRYAELVGSGEFVSAKDLANHLNSNSIASISISPKELDFFATGQDRTSATPASINTEKLRELSDQYDAVIVPGFSAINAAGDSVLLGRGGSDISAVFIAHSLGLSSVRLLKDVDALYDKDPNKFDDANPIHEVDYQTALQLGGELIQPEAINYAASKGVKIIIASVGETRGTQIGDFSTKSKTAA